MHCRSLRFPTRGSKTYIPNNFYTKTTYSPLLSENFGGSAAPSRPLEAAPLNRWVVPLAREHWLPGTDVPYKKG
ncbi:hypothetical protein Hanom_Chr04g00384281 [Helianthus anomalus]